jgi:GR25 family glycosyltransferase involved in LPS biosynthesis
VQKPVTVFINLESAAERRSSLERNFKQFAPSDWALVRAPAITATQAADVAWKIRATEKACYLSHLAAIHAAVQNRQPLWIREDDTRIGARSCSMVSDVLVNQPYGYDLMFTDLTVGNPQTIMQFFLFLRSLPPGRVGVVNLAEAGLFAGMTSYLVNPESAAKLHKLLTVESLNLPIDIAVRNLIYSKQLTAACLLPFLTSSTPLNAQSQISPQTRGALPVVWDLIREMFWIDRDIEQIERTLDRFLLDQPDRDARVVGKIFHSLALPSMQHD